jgi:putative membrane protein
MNHGSKTPNSTEMALDRTWPAHERTLMARVRTATSMIGFGFTIYKFFDYQAERGVSARPGIVSPRTFARIMISFCLTALLLATFAHRKETKHLAALLGVRRSSLAEIVAGIDCWTRVIGSPFHVRAGMRHR